jgi:hypothetical protein
MKEVSFIGSISQSGFDNCNLDSAIFNDTQLKEVNFLTAYNYKIDQFNPMKKADFQLKDPGLLDKYDIKIQ